MEREQRQRARDSAARLSKLVELAKRIESGDSAANTRSEQAARSLATRVVRRDFPDDLRLQVTALGPGDAKLLGDIISAQDLWQRKPEDRAIVQALIESVAPSLPLVRKASGIRRRFMGAPARAEGERLSEYIIEFDHWAQSQSQPVHERLAFLAYRSNNPSNTDISIPHLLERHPFHSLLPGVGRTSVVVPSEDLATIRDACQRLGDAAENEQRARAAAVQAGDEVRRLEADRFVAGVPVERLRDVTNARIRVSALEGAGVKTVGDVFLWSRSLQTIPGIGETSAQRIQGAARSIWQTTFDEMPARIDVGLRRPETRDLLAAVRDWQRARDAIGSVRIAELHAAFAPVLNMLEAGAHLVGSHEEGRARDLISLAGEL
ncbi:MAG: hypothetical protein Q4F67_14220, partial [Propionibacteriaceae bacterium]|nr:hypothetical protein [Propionibacteriaceae bacterium]